MAILISNEICSAVKAELEAAQHSVQVISAYCKNDAISAIDGFINPGIHDKKIMLRFRMDDILKGSSDLSVARFCLDRGWKIFVRFDLHAKTYIVDNKRGIVTSANATNSGLGLGKHFNLEMGTLVAIEQDDLKKIDRLYKDAVVLDEKLLKEMDKQVKAAEAGPSGDFLSHEWSKEITDKFTPEITTLFSYEIPGEQVDANSYIDFLDEDFHGDRSSLKNAFRWSNVYLWLLATLRKNNNCLYFGALTEKLHDALISDPKPYRKEVKTHLSNLLKLIEDLEMDEILIDRPNYSQRIRLVR